MQIEKYTARSRGFIENAQGLALRSGHQRFTPEHLLKVLLDDEEGLAANLIRSAGGKPDVAKAKTEEALAELPKVEGSGAGQVYLGPETARTFEQAEKIAEKGGDSFVTAETMLLALAMGAGTKAAQVLKDAGVKPERLGTAIADLRKGRTADSASAEDSYDALKKYARDITQAAKDGASDIHIEPYERSSSVRFGPFKCQASR